MIASLMPLLCLFFGCGGGSIVAAPGGNSSISGTIAGGPQATVVLSGASSATTTADSMGNYTFANLANGSYIVTPTASSCFGVTAPLQQPVTVSGASVSAVNFTGTDLNLKFCDDFTGTTLSPSWFAMTEAGDASNMPKELECYVPAQDVVSISDLTITPIVQSATCGQPSTQMAYTSGKVVWSSFSFTYGTVEFRAKMPGGTGTWPAIWLLGKNCQPSTANGTYGNACAWPLADSDEIDIAEILSSNYSQVNQQIHTGGAAGGPPLHNDGCTPSTADTSQALHVYQLVWSAGSLVWKIDGTTTCSISQSYVPSTPMYLIINTAVGGAGGTPNTATWTPSTQLLVDYVKVTQP